MKAQHKQYQDSCIGNSVQSALLQDQINSMFTSLAVKQRLLQLFMFLLGIVTGFLMR